jgi:hypothetical protein
MVMLTANIAHRSKVPLIAVENQLEPGKYRLRLVVVDDSDNASLPSDIILEVAPRRVIPVEPDILVRPDIFIRPDVITRPTGPVINPEIFTRPTTPVINPEIVARPTRPIVTPDVIARPISPALNPGFIGPIRPRRPIG